MILTEEQKKWRAETDAYTLSEAEAIKADPDRLELAKKAAEGMLEEQLQKVSGLRKIAKLKEKKQ